MSNQETKKVRVVIADDHQIFRDGLKQLLAKEADIEVVAEADNGDALLALILEHKPDVAITDISMPGASTEEILEELDNSESECLSVALTMHTELEFANQLLALGMFGYVIKDAAFDELMIALRTVLRGDQYLCRAIIARTDETDSLPILTRREISCLRYTAAGETAKQVARRLEISERTVRFHFSNICQKYGVRRKSEAVAKAIQHKIIEL